LGLLQAGVYRFCWVVDIPLYRAGRTPGTVEFSHTPFVLPQVDLETLEITEPLAIASYQYKLSCNGMELGKGDLRNHRRELLRSAFAIAGFSPDEIDRCFRSMMLATGYGLPPHGGIAIGFDLMVMQIAEAPSVRDVIAFPMSGSARHVLVDAPSSISEDVLTEFGIAVTCT
jgi:aspartyl-tRNA synthetase